MHDRAALAVVAAGMLAITPALAQVTPPAAPGSKQAIPEKQGEPLQTGRSQSLSKKLHDSNGVIRPKGNVDPRMHAPAPDPTPHSTPVIPPSATGGDTAK